MGTVERKTYLPAGWPVARAYLVVFALTLVERLTVLAVAWWRRDFPSDGQDYVAMAQALRAGAHFTPYWPPGLPVYLAGLAPGGGHVAVRLAMLGLWALFCWGFYRLAKALQVEGWAWIGLLLFGLSPVAVQMSLDPLTEMPVGALLLVGLSAGVVCLGRASAWEYGLMGGAFGLMALVRPSALPLALVVPLLCAVRSRRWVMNVGAAALALALVGGWMVEAHRMCGAWVINTANGKNLWYGNNADTPNYRTWYFGSHHGSAEIERYPEFGAVTNRLSGLPAVEQNAAYQKLAVEYVESHPGRFVVRTANRVRCYFGFDTFTAIALRETARRWFWPVLGVEALIYCGLMGFAFFWIASAPKEFWRSWEVWVVACAVLFYGAPYWVSMSHPTYHFPVVAPILLLGFVGWKWGRKSLAGWIAVGVFLAVQVEWVLHMAG